MLQPSILKDFLKYVMVLANGKQLAFLVGFPRWLVRVRRSSRLRWGVS
jgi:hypothetical protein